MKNKQHTHGKSDQTQTTAKERAEETVKAAETAEAEEKRAEEGEEKGAEKGAEKQASCEEAKEPAGEGLEDALAKLAVANDKYLRLQAEFDNYRKRTARERMDLVLTAGEDVIKGLLPVLDDCERGLAVIEDAQAKEGVELIYRKLTKYLESKGLKPIEAMGLALDTDKHAAVAQCPAPDPEQKGKIIDIVLQGYTLNGKVIRFANVVVGL